MNTATQLELSQDILTKAVRKAAQPLRGTADDYDALLEFVGDARFVLFHEAGLERFLLLLGGDRRVAGLGQPRLERAIGVIYRPDAERTSHYFHASLAVQFDTVLHFDRTRAVEPLECTALWHKAEVPETFPSGL